MLKKMIAITTAVLLLFCPVSVKANESETRDTSKNWSYIVKFNEYDHCQILPLNGLIKVGRKIGEYRLGGDGPLVYDLVYGLLDRKGVPLTGLIFEKIGYPNSDGYMLATVKDNNRQPKEVLINHLGEVLPSPEGAVITLFDRSYSVETEDEYILYVNNLSYHVTKKALEKSGVRFNSECKNQVIAVYSSCFLLLCYGETFVFGYDGKLRLKTEGDYGNTPQGLFTIGINKKMCFVDFDGSIIIPALYDRLVKAYSAPDIFCYSNDINGNRYGLIDLKDPQAFSGMEFYGIPLIDAENRVIFTNDGYGFGKGVYSFDGKEILPPECVDIGKVSEGLISFQRNNVSGFVDLQGSIVFESELYFDESLNYMRSVYSFRDFSDGLAGYSKGDGTYGYINHEFEPVIELDADWLYPWGNFQEGLAAVMFRDELVFINREGKIVITQEPGGQPWMYSSGFSDGLAVVARHEPVAINNSILYEQANNIENGIITVHIK